MRYWLVALLVLLFPLSATAKLDPGFTFSTIETEHFSIHFHQGLEEIAHRTAGIAEELYPAMTREFAWKPEGKTEVVLVDNTDFANGLSTAVPYNAIYLQIVPPDIDSTIGEYDDWLRILFIHEFTHILTSDPMRGYAKVMRTIFGKPLPAGDLLSLAMFLAAAPPNIFMPRWWHEGNATWGETRFSASGRGRSTYYDMILRAAVAENNLPRVDLINGDVPYWPSGNLPYIYGMRLTRFIADTYGNDAAGKLSTAHSGRFPYAITTPPEELTGGRDYVDLYRAMLIDLQREQGARLETLGKRTFTTTAPLSRDGENLTNPRFSPDGSLIAHTRHDPHGHTTLVIMSKDGEKLHEVRRNSSDGSVCWSPDGGTLYFTQAEITRGFNVYQDLYAYDLKMKRLQRLTTGLRLRDVDLAADGRLFAAVISSRGSQNLAILDAKHPAETPPRFLTNHRQLRIATPRWSPDGKRIAYSLTDNQKRTSLHVIETETRQDTALLEKRFTSAWPTWYPDGRHLLFVSDETGVFNLFVTSADGKQKYQLTHLPTGALQPDLSPDGTTAAVALYSSRGFTLATVKADQTSWFSERGPAISPGWVPDAGSPTNPAIQPASPATVQENPYSPWKTLLPRFWIPTAASDGTGVRIGAFTAGQDVLGRHTYALAADYGAKYRRLFSSLLYQNDSFYPSFSLRGYEQPVLYSDLLQRGDYTELNRGLVAQVAVPVNFLESAYRFTAGYHLQEERALSTLSGGRFNGLPVFQGRRDNVYAGIAFSNSLKYPWSISEEEGRTISLRYRYYGSAVGSEIRSDEYEGSYDEYFLLPGRLLRHHVLWGRVSGGISTGNRTVQQAFQLGGTPSELNSYPLRGYPSRFEAGKYIATGTLEYRAPIWYFLRGVGTKPFFFDRLHGAAFVDAGEVWDDSHSFRASSIRTGAGVEARFDMTVGYWLKITPTLGFAHGFNHGGENQVYFGISLNL